MGPNPLQRLDQRTSQAQQCKAISQAQHKCCSHNTQSLVHQDSAAAQATRPKHAALPVHLLQQLDESSYRTSQAQQVTRARGGSSEHTTKPYSPVPTKVPLPWIFGGLGASCGFMPTTRQSGHSYRSMLCGSASRPLQQQTVSPKGQVASRLKQGCHTRAQPANLENK